jgi:20S proteasome alpha/beta subunit
MTLAMALRAYDGLVLATDSRATGGQLASDDTSEKFLQVNRDIGVMTYGLAVPGYRGISRLVEAVKSRREELTHFGAIEEAARSIFGEAYQEWLEELEHKHQVPPINSLVGFILGGYDSTRNQFEIAHGESPDFEERRFPGGDLLAAEWHIARFLMNKLYYPEISVALLSELAVFLLVETAVSQPAVGGPLQLATITESQGFQRLHDQDINEILERSQRRFCVFRRLLMEAFADENGALDERVAASLGQEAA